MQTKICPYDGKTFEVNHGNRKYCPGKCQTEHNNMKMKQNNDLVKRLSQGFKRNYRLFTELLPESGSMNIPVYNLLGKSFDEHAFYGTSKDEEGVVWQHINDYYFNISNYKGTPILYLFKR